MLFRSRQIRRRARVVNHALLPANEHHAGSLELPTASCHHHALRRILRFDCHPAVNCARQSVPFRPCFGYSEVDLSQPQKKPFVPHVLTPFPRRSLTQPIVYYPFSTPRHSAKSLKPTALVMSAHSATTSFIIARFSLSDNPQTPSYPPQPSISNNACSSTLGPSVTYPTPPSEPSRSSVSTLPYTPSKP